MSIITNLEDLNRKERCHLICLAVGNSTWPNNSLQLSDCFRQLLGKELSLTIPVLVVARAPRIPAIIGLSPSEAKARLRAHGLSVVGVEEVTTRKNAAGVVVGTRPDVGEPYPADRQVYLQVEK